MAESHPCIGSNRDCNSGQGTEIVLRRTFAPGSVSAEEGGPRGVRVPPRAVSLLAQRAQDWRDENFAAHSVLSVCLSSVHAASNLLLLLFILLFGPSDALLQEQFIEGGRDEVKRIGYRM